MKYINISTWYSGIDLGEPFRQGWKQWVKRKGDNIKNNRRNGRRCTEAAPVTITMFVPSTRNGELIKMLQDVEDDLRGELP